MARLSLPSDPHVEGNAAPFPTIGETEALGKETGLVQTGPVRDRHAPSAWRPRVLLHHVGPRTTGDRHGHRGSRIDNRRELVPGELSPSAKVGRWIHGRQAADACGKYPAPNPMSCGPTGGGVPPVNCVASSLQVRVWGCVGVPTTVGEPLASETPPRPQTRASRVKATPPSHRRRPRSLASTRP